MSILESFEKVRRVFLAMQPLVFKVTTKSEVAGDKHSKTLYKWQVLVEDSSASHTEILDTAMSVTFLLHPSFKRSKQVCRAAPYYINEVGWGAFQLKINIRFKDLKLQFDHFVHFEEQEYVVTLNVDEDATVKIDNLMTRVVRFYIESKIRPCISRNCQSQPNSIM